MSVSIKDERRVLTAEEFDVVNKSHYPAINELSDDELKDNLKRLRTMRDKARDNAREKRREIRGKAAPRGARAAKDNSGDVFKKQIFASALKRINKRLTRLVNEDKRQAHLKAAYKALERKQANDKNNMHEIPGHSRRFKAKGMRSIPNNKRQDLTINSERGRVSQFVKNAQARRDSKYTGIA